MDHYTSEETLPAITLDELLDTLDGLDTVSEPRGIPFPQANSLDRVIDLCISLDFRNSDKDRIAEDYKFVDRQADYYSRAAEYLGLVRRTSDKEVELADPGIDFLELRDSEATLYLMKLILCHAPFRESFDVLLETGEMPSADLVAEIIRKNTWYTGSTPRRRASTVISWLRWIWSHVDRCYAV